MKLPRKVDIHDIKRNVRERMGPEFENVKKKKYNIVS
jgi:hypothetical protein